MFHSPGSWSYPPFDPSQQCCRLVQKTRKGALVPAIMIIQVRRSSRGTTEGEELLADGELQKDQVVIYHWLYWKGMDSLLSLLSNSPQSRDCLKKKSTEGFYPHLLHHHFFSAGTKLNSFHRSYFPAFADRINHWVVLQIKFWISTLDENAPHSPSKRESFIGSNLQISTWERNQAHALHPDQVLLLRIPPSLTGCFMLHPSPHASPCPRFVPIPTGLFLL